MAPIKYEEQMKEKLEKRSLNPSPESWAALSDRLDAQQKNKSKSLFWWIGIAASIIGIVFITAEFFNNQPVQNSSPTVVESNENTIPEKKNEIINSQTPSNKVAAEEIAVDEIVPLNSFKNQPNSKSNTSVISPIKKDIETNSALENDVAQVEKNANEESIESVNEIKKTTLTFEDQKIQDVVAQINHLKANGNTVSNAEIDSLLKKAQNEILNNRLYNENTRTVDANMLLQDVEEDLQQSFRSKVFEALQSGYESVKTAVAERNN